MMSDNLVFKTDDVSISWKELGSKFVLADSEQQKDFLRGMVAGTCKDLLEESDKIDWSLKPSPRFNWAMQCRYITDSWPDSFSKRAVIDMLEELWIHLKDGPEGDSQ